LRASVYTQNHKRAVLSSSDDQLGIDLGKTVPRFREIIASMGRSDWLRD